MKFLIYLIFFIAYFSTVSFASHEDNISLSQPNENHIVTVAAPQKSLQEFLNDQNRRERYQNAYKDLQNVSTGVKRGVSIIPPILFCLLGAYTGIVSPCTVGVMGGSILGFFWGLGMQTCYDLFSYTNDEKDKRYLLESLKTELMNNNLNTTHEELDNFFEHVIAKRVGG